MKRLMVILSVLLLLTGCSAAPMQAKNLGGIMYSVKMLDGLFFERDGERLLISGTEVRAGAQSQVLIYNTDRDELVLSQYLENCVSMTAFCEADGGIYFATCSSGDGTGCDLYRWDEAANEALLCAHFSETSICDLAWDGGDALYLGTASPANAYAYDLVSGAVRAVVLSPTDGLYIRSMCGGGGHCI